MTVNELTKNLWYHQEIEIAEKEYKADKKDRIVWTGNNSTLRASDINTVKIRHKEVVSFGVTDNKLIIVV